MYCFHWHDGCLLFPMLVPGELLRGRLPGAVQWDFWIRGLVGVSGFIGLVSWRLGSCILGRVVRLEW